MSVPNDEPGSILDRQRWLQVLSQDVPSAASVAGDRTKTATPELPNTQSLASPGHESLDGKQGTTPHNQSTSPPTKKRHFVGQYELMAHLGSGGMGVVFRAHDPALKRDVAVKLLNNGVNDPRLATRFMIEAQAIARLERHNNIVKVHGVDKDHTGIPYYVMEYVSGGTLAGAAKRLQADRPRLIGILAKVCRAVGYMHEKAVSHRDLKPLNILLTESDEPMVADFGLAKLHDNDHGVTQNDSLLGTRLYMSPEQTRGRAEDLSPACDVWSLGVMLYELVSGRLPFHSKVQTELFELIETADPAPLTWADDTPEPQLDAVVRSALAKDPAQRPSATQLAEDLERWLAGEKVTAKPPAPRRRSTSRWWALAAALLIGVIGTSLWALTPKPETKDSVETLPPVLLIGGTNADVKFQPILNSAFTTKSDADGHFSVDSSKGPTFLQLSDQRFPNGTILEAKMRQISSPKNRSYAGIYCNGTTSGTDFYCVMLRVDMIARAGTDIEKLPRDKSGITLDTGVWDSTGRFGLMPCGHGVLIARSRMRPERERTSVIHLRLEIDPNGTVLPFIVNSAGMTPLPQAECVLNWNLTNTVANRGIVTPQVPGTGLGLMIDECQASFWDVTLRSR